jgi:hypothetical protein
MKSAFDISVLKSLAALIAVFVLLGRARSQTSSDELRLGVEAYKNSGYEESIAHFRKAVELDSSNVPAHMYLATACLVGYVPGVDTRDNLND